MHSWSLYLFNLAIQSAVGGCILLLIYNGLLNKVVVKDVLHRYNSKSVFTLAILSIVGLVISFFHLGYPLHAFNAINNLGSSWLSREIFFTSIFIVLLCLTVLVTWKKQQLNQPLLVLGSIAGVVAVYSMGSLYSNTIFTEWNGVNTIVGFYCTAFVLGTVVISLLFLPLLNKAAETFQAIKMPTLLIVLSAFIVQFIFMATFGSGIAALNISVSLIRWICSAVAAILLVYLYYPRRESRIELVYLAFGLMLIGELIGKYLFYSPLA